MMPKDMFRLSVIVLPIILFSVTSCTKKEVPGLVAHYSFNGDASDESRNQNNAIVHDATLTSDRFGNTNSAYRFNGTSAFIFARVKNMPAPDAAQTISWWFMIEQPPDYSDSLGADNMIALVDTVDGIGLQFGYRAPGYQTLGLDTWYWGGSTVFESEQPAIQVWHHCLYTYDGQTHRFYMNGDLISQSEVEPQAGTPDMLMFGNYPGGNQFFTGALDDVRIYNRVLSQSEIEIVFNH